MKYIRQATEQDVSRIGEILVFNNRINFLPIFQDEQYSFGEMQVLNIAGQFLEEPEKLRNTYVYDDGIVRGLICLDKCAIRFLEQVMGIEPTRPAWKAGILPLNYTRKIYISQLP